MHTKKWPLVLALLSFSHHWFPSVLIVLTCMSSALSTVWSLSASLLVRPVDLPVVVLICYSYLAPVFEPSSVVSCLILAFVLNLS